MSGYEIAMTPHINESTVESAALAWPAEHSLGRACVPARVRCEMAALEKGDHRGSPLRDGMRGGG